MIDLKKQTSFDIFIIPLLFNCLALSHKKIMLWLKIVKRNNITK